MTGYLWNQMRLLFGLPEKNGTNEWGKGDDVVYEATGKELVR